MLSCGAFIDVRYSQRLKKGRGNFFEEKVRNTRKDDVRQWWRNVNVMSGRNYSQSCFNLERDGVALLEGELAESLNQYFATVAADIPPLDTSCVPSFLPSVEEVPIVHSHVVCKKLLHVKTNKAMGPDSIPPRIIKEFPYELTEPVTKIFNTSISTGEVPILWKCYNIIPIAKVKKSLCESDTRPISVTPILSKVLEDFVVAWMIEDVGQHIDSRQFGSLKESSTTYCLLNLIHNWLSELDNPGCYLRACFLDFSKAFDRIDHTIVIRKLIDLRVRRSIIPWICSFRTDQWQCVKLGQTVSNWLPVRADVPQGTKLGPILFVIMINDLKLASPRCSYWKYVDDITISEFAAARGVSILQSELDNISTWADTKNMVLNTKKGQGDAIDTKVLESVNAHKVLGVTIQSNLKWGCS